MDSIYERQFHCINCDVVTWHILVMLDAIIPDRSQNGNGPPAPKRIKREMFQCVGCGCLKEQEADTDPAP